MTKLIALIFAAALMSNTVAVAGDADQEKQWDDSTDAADDTHKLDNPVTKFIKKYVPTGKDEGTMDEQHQKDLDDNQDMPPDK
jgi:hypothetical protein